MKFMGVPMHICPLAPKSMPVITAWGYCPYCGETLGEDMPDFSTPFPKKYDVEEFPDSPQSRQRHGSPTFYKLLEVMAEVHDRKSHDYASNSNPFGNYEFSGLVAALFAHSPKDAGFAGRLAEKLYRIANLERDGKTPLNESIEDTEKDLCVITALWMAARIDRRASNRQNILGALKEDMKKGMDRISQSQDTLSCMISLEPLMTVEDKQQFLSYLTNCLRSESSRNRNINPEKPD